MLGATHPILAGALREGSCEGPRAEHGSMDTLVPSPIPSPSGSEDAVPALCHSSVRNQR